jgi:hypothetical protein
MLKPSLMMSVALLAALPSIAALAQAAPVAAPAPAADVAAPPVAVLSAEPALVATPAPAVAPAPAAAPEAAPVTKTAEAAAADRANEVICRKQQETGSLVKVKKTCHTRQQWAYIEQENKRMGQDFILNNQGRPGSN